MRPMLGRLKNRKNRKNFGVQKSVRQLRFRQGFERFFGPGPNFRKKGIFGDTRRIPRKRSHGQQHKPWEPCACFPDYGRGQALTPSNQNPKSRLFNAQHAPQKIAQSKKKMDGQ